MSTKTFRKRIAQLAILALGVGSLSVASVTTANAAAKSISVDSASVTVIESTAYNTNLRTENGAAFLITVKDDSTTPVVANLANGETITVSVIAAPAQSAASGSTVPTLGDLSFLNVKDRTLMTVDSGTGGTITYLTNNCDPTEIDDTSFTGKYCFNVFPTLDVSDWGYYTIAIDLKDVNGNILERETVKYQLVSSAATSGATVTIGQAGPIVAGETYAQSATKYMTATLADANGGRVILNDTATVITTRPSLSATLENSTGTTLNALVATDDGVTADDAWTNGDGDGAIANDGVYGLIPSAAVSSSISSTTASTIRVRFGLVNATKTVTALKVASSYPSNSSLQVTATDAYTTNESTSASVAATYELPLTTTSAVLKWTLRNSAGAALADEPITVTATWTGHNAGAISPLSGATNAQVLKSDNAGVVSLTVTQTGPLNGSQVVVAVTGQAASQGAFGSTTLKWRAPVVTYLTTSPNADFQAVAAAATSVTVTALDQFRKPMSGIVIQPSITGTTSANYTTTAKATLTTGADGTATYTVTGGAAAKTDTFAFSAAAGAVTATAVKATYIAALPVIATLTGSYSSNQNEATTTATVTTGTYAGLFSTTPISSTAPIAVSITKNYGISWTLSNSSSDAEFKFRVLAKDSAGAIVAGMPVTVTGDGAWFTDSCTGASALLVSSKTCYTNSAGYVHVAVVATKAGTPSVTFTAGSVSATQAIATEVAADSARTLAISGDKSGTAYKRGNMTATVTDRFGNPVSDVSVMITTSGVGSLTGGAKTNTYTTDANGNISFALESTEAGTTTVTGRLVTAYDSESAAGFQGTTFVGSLFGAAGVRSTTASLVWAAGVDPTQAAAEAATDAALEAIDAANAATDAANLAAEAADAATVAAEEARDAADSATAAVEALASEVATLIAGLKAQLTTLANTVAKIAKKVKA